MSYQEGVPRGAPFVFVARLGAETHPGSADLRRKDFIGLPL